MVTKYRLRRLINFFKQFFNKIYLIISDKKIKSNLLPNKYVVNNKFKKFHLNFLITKRLQIIIFKNNKKTLKIIKQKINLNRNRHNRNFAALNHLATVPQITHIC